MSKSWTFILPVACDSCRRKVLECHSTQCFSWFFSKNGIAERLEQLTGQALLYPSNFFRNQTVGKWKPLGRLKASFVMMLQVSHRLNISFKHGRILESEPCSITCLNNHFIAKVNAMVMRDRRETIPKIAKEVGIIIFSAHFIVSKNLATKKMLAKFVQKLLAEQKLVLKTPSF